MPFYVWNKSMYRYLDDQTPSCPQNICSPLLLRYQQKTFPVSPAAKYFHLNTILLLEEALCAATASLVAHGSVMISWESRVLSDLT
jgi:hypothetical protein